MNYITRVVLHYTDSSNDYSDLHREMDQRGFKRTIVDNNQVRYALPDGEYFIQTNKTIEEVKVLANAAVDAVMQDENPKVQKANREPTVMVIQTDRIIWTGLLRSFTRKISS